MKGKEVGLGECMVAGIDRNREIRVMLIITLLGFMSMIGCWEKIGMNGKLVRVGFCFTVQVILCRV